MLKIKDDSLRTMVGKCSMFFSGFLIALSPLSYYPSGFDSFLLLIIALMLVFFVIWIAVAYWVYTDAKKRNENAVLWLVIVFVAGLLGILLWFVFRPPVGGRKTTPLRICPNCGREIPFNANVCSYCGKKFESFL